MITTRYQQRLWRFTTAGKNFAVAGGGGYRDLRAPGRSAWRSLQRSTASAWGNGFHAGCCMKDTAFRLHSFSMRRSLFPDPSPAIPREDSAHSRRILELLSSDDALVPQIWAYEIANVIFVSSVLRKRIANAQIAEYGSFEGVAASSPARRHPGCTRHRIGGPALAVAGVRRCLSGFGQRQQSPFGDHRRHASRSGRSARYSSAISPSHRNCKAHFNS